MAGCNPRKCSPKKLCFNCAQRVCDERERLGFPRYQAAHTGRWSWNPTNLDNIKRTRKPAEDSYAKLTEVAAVLSGLPLLEYRCRAIGLYKTAMAIRKAVQHSGFEAEKLFGKWIKEIDARIDDKKKKAKS